MSSGDENVREKSKRLVNSVLTRQNLIREELAKMRVAQEGKISKKPAINTTKTVSFCENYRENSITTRRPKIKFRSKSASSSPSRVATLSDLDSESESESEAEDDIESDNLAELIRFKDFETLERLKTSDEEEFLKHVEARRQSFLNRDYRENVPVKRAHRPREKKPDTNTRKKDKRSQSEPSYLRPTEASINMSRPKIPKPDEVKNKSKEVPSSKTKKTTRFFPRNKPLLGLDFALDSLTTKKTSVKLQKSDEYWQELCRFREQNEEECVSKKPMNFDGTTSSLFLDQSNMNEFLKNADDELEDGVNHRCIHSFTLNERLFPVPVYKDKNGKSICPVCKSTRKEGSIFSPQFCKVSIPNYRLVEPIAIELNGKFDQRVQDTLSLAEHCVAGYQNAPKKSVKSYQTPPARNIDLKSSTVNYKAAHSKQPLTLTDLKLIEANRDPATAAIYSKANAMRYELEDQHLKRLKELIQIK